MRQQCATVNKPVSQSVMSHVSEFLDVSGMRRGFAERCVVVKKKESASWRAVCDRHYGVGCVYRSGVAGHHLPTIQRRDNREASAPRRGMFVGRGRTRRRPGSETSSHLLTWHGSGVSRPSYAWRYAAPSPLPIIFDVIIASKISFSRFPLGQSHPHTETHTHTHPSFIPWASRPSLCSFPFAFPPRQSTTRPSDRRLIHQ